MVLQDVQGTDDFVHPFGRICDLMHLQVLEDALEIIDNFGRQLDLGQDHRDRAEDLPVFVFDRIGAHNRLARKATLQVGAHGGPGNGLASLEDALVALLGDRLEISTPFLRLQPLGDGLQHEGVRGQAGMFGGTGNALL
jgi:hypothetical protein